MVLLYTVDQECLKSAMHRSN